MNRVAKAAALVLGALPPWAAVYLPEPVAGLVTIVCAAGLVWLVPNAKAGE